MLFEINIDEQSGFCFGVVNAIKMAEDQLVNGNEVWCIGQIVHNEEETSRLTHLGLKQTSVETLGEVRSGKVLIRAHGEPPATYERCKALKLPIVDATCPLVLRLQQSVARAADEMRRVGGQILIYGKPGHPEVVGLVGQVRDVRVQVIFGLPLIDIDYSLPTRLFSQTTMDALDYQLISESVHAGCTRCGNVDFAAAASVCPQVSHRRQIIQSFARSNDVVLFVSGSNSSNGKVLYGHCQAANKRSHFVGSASDLKPEWFINAQSIGITGATSTPMWLIRRVAETVRLLLPTTVTDNLPDTLSRL